MNLLYKFMGNSNFTKRFILCFSLLIPAISLAQQYSIDWHKVAGGGGTSSGGQYSLTGTIGQPDAANSAGGSYELLGGFWPGGPLCFVDSYDFVRFADYWLETGTGLPADLNGDGVVDIYDLKLFADEWLCSCPYNWPLK